LAGLSTCIPTQNPRTHLKPRQATWSGIKASRFLPVSGCEITEFTSISTAILHASYLLVAGKNAAANFTHLPIFYFFQPNIETATKVAAVFDAVVAAQLGQGPQAAAFCKDTANICRNPQPGDPQLLGFPESVAAAGNTPPPGFVPSVVLCAAGLALPPNPTPCTSTAGQKTIGKLMLHEMVHLPETVDIIVNDIPKAGYQQAAKNVNANLLAGVDTTNDADAYAYLGSWSWGYGLGQAGLWNGTRNCVPGRMRGNLDSGYDGPNGKWYTAG